MSTFPSGDSAAAAAIFARALNLSRTASTCFVAILGYDWLVNLPQEYRKIWKSAHRTPIKWIYLCLRYWTILAGVGSLAIYYSAVPTSTCNHLAKLLLFVAVPIVIAYQLLLVIRCVAIWNDSRVLLCTFIAILIGETTLLSYISGTVVGLPLPFDGPCFPYNNGSRGDRLLGTAYFWLPLAVDILITAATLVKCIQLWSSTRLVSSVLQVFIREGLFFFIVVCGCNLINGILLLQTSDPALTNFFALPTFLLSSILACRMVLVLRKDPRDAAATTDSHPYTSSFRCSLCSRALSDAGPAVVGAKRRAGSLGSRHSVRHHRVTLHPDPLEEEKEDEG